MRVEPAGELGTRIAVNLYEYCGISTLPRVLRKRRDDFLSFTRR
jgi:hypothetical protein